MPSAHDFLVALALVLGVAAITTVLFNKLKQPVVLGYLVAGVLVGPHAGWFPLNADQSLIHALSELGVILLMFSLGLEFRLGSLLKVGPTALLTCLFECSVMLWLGFLVGRAFGWTSLEAIFTGAVVAISSTTIVARAFEELKVKDPVKGVVVGVLLVEDLVAIVLMATLTALATGATLTAGSVGLTLGRLGAFLAALVVGGLLLVPRVMKLVLKQQRDEMIVVTAIGLSFGFSLLAQAAGYSVALGAFIAGSLVAETGEGARVEHAVRPVRDLFAAVFFVSVGMLFDPAMLKDSWLLVLVLTALVIAGKALFVSLGAFFTGNGVRTSVQVGLSLAQIGEFSFIMAGLGLSLNAAQPSLYPVAIAVCALTTLTTPTLIARAPKIAEAIDSRLPHRVQTLVSLYGSWLERLRAPSAQAASPVRKLVRLALIDAAVIVATLIVLSLLESRLEGLPRVALLAVGAVTVLIVGFGFTRVLRALGDAVAERAMPRTGRVDLSRAPRAALAAAFRVLIVTLVFAPALALLSPFVPPIWLSAVMVLVLIALLFTFWQRATDFEGHLRAGAEVIVAALASGTSSEDSLHGVREQLPGLGEPSSLVVGAKSVAAERTLAELNLRGQTGATVLAIHRGDGDVVLPTAGERLRVGDVIALAGTSEAVDAARELMSRERQELPAREEPQVLEELDPTVRDQLREAGVDLGLVVLSRPSDWEIFVIHRGEGRVLARGLQGANGGMTWTLEAE
ncbi:MAG: cation:proton antiporter [Archangium sp.]